MADTVKIRYKGIGTPDEIIVEGYTGGPVRRGDVIEVPLELAYGRPGNTHRADGTPLDPFVDYEEYRSPRGGLLDQTDAWELADPPTSRGSRRAVDTPDSDAEED